MKILLVENHADTADYLRAYLRGLGHEASVARSISEAREALSETEFAVLISDISLPDGSGWDLKTDLEDRPIYAVAMSGLCSKEDQRRSQEAGFRHHLVKPFLPSELDAILEGTLQSNDSMAVG